MYRHILGEEKFQLNSDSISKTDNNYGTNDDAFSIEFPSTICASGVPNHELVLKVGAPIMLLRNMDQLVGVYNGTRLSVNHLNDRVFTSNCYI